MKKKRYVPVLRAKFDVSEEEVITFYYDPCCVPDGYEFVDCFEADHLPTVAEIREMFYVLNMGD